MGGLGTRRLSFWIKVALAMALTIVADQLFYGAEEVGWTLGGFALALLLASLIAQPAMRRDRRAWAALGLATGFALLLLDAPGFVRWCLFWTALAVAVLSPRTAPGAGAARWSLRIAYQSVAGIIAPVLDVILLNRHLRPGNRPLAKSLLAVVPAAVGGLVFLGLFAAANPVIGEVLGDLPAYELDTWRTLFALTVFVSTWMMLRPQWLRRRVRRTVQRPAIQPVWFGFSSIILALVVFNLVFALQNGLDIAFLWSGARLPGHVTMADYAHRGAYTLILTALLAGLFMLVALRPGWADAQHRWMRRLVAAWVAQTLMLVASSMLRTIDYVQSYSLTRLRIAALAWMVLVGVGLALVCWRLLRGKSGTWLVNRIALAMSLTVIGLSVVDLGAVAGEWNVTHAKEVGGAGVNLDVGYLVSLGDSALIPLVQLSRHPLPPTLRDQVTEARNRIQSDLQSRQSHWRTWTWRGQRRLDTALAMPAPVPVRLVPPSSRIDARPAARNMAP